MNLQLLELPEERFERDPEPLEPMSKPPAVDREAKPLPHEFIYPEATAQLRVVLLKRLLVTLGGLLLSAVLLWGLSAFYSQWRIGQLQQRLEQIGLPLESAQEGRDE